MRRPLKILRANRQRQYLGRMRARRAVFIPQVPGVIPEIKVVTMLDVHIGQGAVEACLAKADALELVFPANLSANCCSYFFEAQFYIMIARNKRDMPPWQA